MKGTDLGRQIGKEQDSRRKSGGCFIFEGSVLKYGS